MKWHLFAALTLSSGLAHAQNSAPNTPSNPRFIICIDPGHPSETAAGAEANGLIENTINYQVGLRLKDLLLKDGIPVVMTKASLHQNVTNRRRAEIANQNGAALMIRLHCDAGGGSGFTWYYPDRSGTKYGVSGPPKSVQQSSRAAAYTLNEAMKPILRGYLPSNPIKTDAATGVGGKQGGVLTGSIFARVPTALVEMAFITNKRDARFIASATGQEKMARALEAGVLAWRASYRG